MRRHAPYLAAVLILMVSAGFMHRALEVWTSDLTLWRHAALIAPYKPRVALNYGVSLLQTKDVIGAVRQLARAAELTGQPHIPAWDQHLTRQAAAKNLRALVVPWNEVVCECTTGYVCPCGIGGGL